MARTVRTGAQQRGSGDPPSGDGSVTNENKNGESSSSPSSAAAVPAAASRSTHDQTTEARMGFRDSAEACMGLQDSMSGRSEADYLRASTTVARMHPWTSEERGGYRGNTTRDDVHDSARQPGRPKYSGRGGRHRHHSSRASREPHRDQQHCHYNNRRCYDDERGRYGGHSHQREGYRRQNFPFPKRRKDWHGGSSGRGWHRAKSARGRHGGQQRYDEQADEIDKLKRHVAWLEKKVQDMEAMPARDVAPVERPPPAREVAIRRPAPREVRTAVPPPDCATGPVPSDRAPWIGSAKRPLCDNVMEGAIKRDCATGSVPSEQAPWIGSAKRPPCDANSVYVTEDAIKKEAVDQCDTCFDASTDEDDSFPPRHGAVKENGDDSANEGEKKHPVDNTNNHMPDSDTQERNYGADNTSHGGSGDEAIVNRNISNDPVNFAGNFSSEADSNYEEREADSVNSWEGVGDPSSDGQDSAHSTSEGTENKGKRKIPVDDTNNHASDNDTKDGYDGGGGNAENFNKNISHDLASNSASEVDSICGEREAGSVNRGESKAGNPNTDDQDYADNMSEESHDDDSVDLVLKEEYGIPWGKIAFCCQYCSCCETPKRLKYFSIRNNCGNSGDGGFGNTALFHKGCCHMDTKTHDDYLSPMTKAINEGIETMQKQPPASRVNTLTEINKQYKNAKILATQFENEESEEAKDSSIYTSPVYETCLKTFSQRQKTRTEPLRVLIPFSGIGSATVVLKRLKLPIQTIVYIEHDPVAVEVCKSNHKDDGIEHVYIDVFEDIYGTEDEPDEGKITALLNDYGPFDLVLAAAPCTNYTGLNASRDNASENAQYLLKVGRLIQKLDEIQMGARNVQENVLFLSENVVFSNHEKVDRCYLGLPPIRVDAKDFGPCKRNRFYWINLPVSSADTIKHVASAQSIDGLLDEGYGAVARLIEGEDESSLTVKSNTFLASLERIDDHRMLRYKIDKSPSSGAKTKYKLETYSVGEREKMMGLPAGYVAKPVKELFDNLAKKAFLWPETSAEGKSYREFLPPSLWHFRRKCKFKFQSKSEHPFFHLALSSPKEGKLQLTFYEEEQYCKRLVGNGWSVPVVEYLLGRLPDLFPEHLLKEYDGYNDPHPWEPYKSLR